MFPLTPELLEIFSRQLEMTKQLQLTNDRLIPWVFHRDGQPIKDYYGGWDKAVALLGIMTV